MSSHISASPHPTRGQRLAGVQARANVVRRLGLLAGAGALALLAYFVVKAGILVPPAPQNVRNDVVIAKPDVATGQGARINGFDRNNHAYEIRAAAGQQDKASQNIFHLETMTADFIRPEGENLRVTSDKAQYDSKSKVMDIEGNVVLDQRGKFMARMDKAEVNTVDQTLQSRSPVTVEAKGGTIAAASLTVTENGNRVIFKGGVQAHFGGK